MFRHRRFGAAMINHARFLQLFLDSNSRRKARAPFGMSVPTSFEAHLYCHALMLISRKVGANKLNIYRNAINEALERVVVQVVLKACDALKTSCKLVSMHLVTERHIGFNHVVI